jgi:hypothetical protein
MRFGCFGVIALAIMINSVFAQEVDVQDDSLLMDSFHAPKTIGPSPAIDTITPQSKKSVLTDTTALQRKLIDSVAADTSVRQQEILKPDSLDTASQEIDIGKPEIANTPSTGNSEEKPRLPEHNLSPFSSDRVHYLGVSLDYFSYAEVSNLTDVFPGYPDNYPPNFIQGAPKSTEYGLLFGLDYQGVLRKHGSPWLFRPNIDVQFGIHQTYDGSTQAETVLNRIGDTIGFKFEPVKFYKNNYFIQTGLDVGYCWTHAIVPFYAYSGLKGKFWYRDMTPDSVSYSNQITNSEMYYWFSAPIGLAISIPVSPNIALGLDVCCDLMFYGQMQALYSWWDPENNFTTKSPAVTLSNRAGVHLEFSITFKLTDKTAFQFAPYFTKYAFGQSETEIQQSFNNGMSVGPNVSFSEPSSSTWLLGAKFRMALMSPFTRTR